MIKAICIYHTVNNFSPFHAETFPVYIVAQTVGAIAGAAVLHFASLEKWSLGVNGINTTNTTPAGGFVMEALLTMLLVLVVFASAVDSGNNSSPMLPPLLIGLTVTVAHLLLIPFTGQ